MEKIKQGTLCHFYDTKADKGHYHNGTIELYSSKNPIASGHFDRHGHGWLYADPVEIKPLKED